jgi:prevent-host-death family protein
MRRVSLSEAKRKLSELLNQVSKGEQIGIMRRGKLAALVVPAAQADTSLKEIFRDIERIRNRVKLPKGTTIKNLIEEGRT